MNSRKSEAKIEEWLNGRIKAIGGISYKFVSPGNPGVPDRIYLMPDGRVYFVELKTEIGRLANIQKWQGRRIREMGCRYYVIKGMQQAEDFIREVTDEVRAARLSDVRDPETDGAS